jgi:hypothetical protein
MGGGGAEGLPVAAGAEGEFAPVAAATGTVVIEGGGDFPDEAESEPNFNRDGVAHVGGGGGDRPHGDRPHGGDRGGRGGRPGGGGGRDRGRGGRGGRPGGGGRDRGRGGPGGGRH